MSGTSEDSEQPRQLLRKNKPEALYFLVMKPKSGSLREATNNDIRNERGAITTNPMNIKKIINEYSE